MHVLAVTRSLLGASLALLLGCGPAATAASDAGADAPDAPADVASADRAPPRDAPTYVYRDVPLVDDRFLEHEWDTIQRMSPIPAPYPDPTNRYADDPRAAALGRRLFDDMGFSGDGTVSCAGCHLERRAFTDGLPVAVAQRVMARGRRNTPTVTHVAWSREVLWDGAADAPWAQPVLALENPREHAFTRVAMTARLAEVYRAEYEALFGPLPPVEDRARFPRDARPGVASWDAMRPEDRDAVNRAAANFGKAIQAFERTLRPTAGAFDRYVAGDRSAMSPEARDGLQLFFRVGCIHCHTGPMFTDGGFHALRWPDDAMNGADRGRLAALEDLATSPFRVDSPLSDDRAAFPAPPSPRGDFLGAFRTPSLRDVALTAPYGHAGTVPSLDAVVSLDARGGLVPADGNATGVRSPLLMPFTPTSTEIAALVAFLRALTSGS